MIKLRKAEEQSSTLQRECTDLRAAVDSQSGAWFEDIRTTVQHRIEESMQKARELEKQLKQTEEQHAARVQTVQDEKEQLAAHLSSTLTSCQQLEADFQQSQCVANMMTCAYSADVDRKWPRLSCLCAETPAFRN
jgi:chromosome segregation ATPase